MTTWKIHLAQHRMKHPNMSLKDAMKSASLTYKKHKGGSVSASDYSTIYNAYPESVRKYIDKSFEALAKQNFGEGRKKKGGNASFLESIFQKRG